MLFHQVKVWDLRKKRCLYTIPAHRSLVSVVKWQPGAAHYLVSGGYDCLVKVWSSRDYSLLKVLAGHESKVMAADISPIPGAHVMCSASYDRTIKLWAPEDITDDAADAF